MRNKGTWLLVTTIFTPWTSKLLLQKRFIALDLHFAHFEGGAKWPFQIGCQFNFSADLVSMQVRRRCYLKFRTLFVGIFDVALKYYLNA